MKRRGFLKSIFGAGIAAAATGRVGDDLLADETRRLAQKEVKQERMSRAKDPRIFYADKKLTINLEKTSHDINLVMLPSGVIPRKTTMSTACRSGVITGSGWMPGDSGESYVPMPRSSPTRDTR